MSSDFDRLFDELARVLGRLVRLGSSASAAEGGTGPVSARLDVRVGYLEELVPRRPSLEARDPLIDVIEGEGSIRVVVLLPGVRREDVKVSKLPGSLRVEVKSGSTVFTKEIPCQVPPKSIAVVSEKERNSVVELVFSKRRAGG